MGHRIEELPVITTPSDSDKIVVEHDSLTSQITLARLIAAERNRLNQLESALQSIGDGGFSVQFNTTDTLFNQIDALSKGTYSGFIASYQHQDATGVPENDNYHVRVSVYSASDAFVTITRTYGWSEFTAIKSGGSWSGWKGEPKCFYYTSSVGFADACPASWGSSGLGGVLDAKIKDVISSFTAESITHVTAVNGAAVIAVILFKQTNNYYGGLAFTYHSNPVYGGDGIVLFKYDNNNYRVKIFTNISLPLN